MNNKRNHTKTIHSGIFKKTLWGEGDQADDNIIVNRNNFVTEFDIVSKKDHTLRGRRFRNEVHPINLGHAMDHFEFYKRSGTEGYVALFSLYGPSDGPDERFPIQILLDMGYRKYHQLYNSGAVTYIKEVSYNRE